MSFEVVWSPLAENQLAQHYVDAVEESRRNPLLASEAEAISSATARLERELSRRAHRLGVPHQRDPNVRVHYRFPLIATFSIHGREARIRTIHWFKDRN